MNYEIEFIPSALKEWNSLDNSVRQDFKKVLAKRVSNPFIQSAKLKGIPIDCYKIKLRKLGYRLIYTVEKDRLIIMVLIVERRDIVYKKLINRIPEKA